jgi:DNA topoisomerase-1
MSPAEYFSFTSTITTFLDGVKYSATSELLDFLGWKIVKNKESKILKEKEYNYLLQLKQSHEINLKKITSTVTLKNSKQHYTEAKLVQLLEENGIGRPSTFSSLIDKIQERGYVKKCDIPGKQVVCNDLELEDDTISEKNVTREFGSEKNKLVIQPLGLMVIEFLNKNFEGLFNYEYTKNMEDELDKISKGENLWYELCERCMQEINKFCELLSTEKKCEIKIDDTHFYIIGKHGPVIKRINSEKKIKGKDDISFLSVRDDIDLKKLERGEYKLEDVFAAPKTNQIILGTYKELPLILKKGKFGLYVTWGENSKSLSSFGNRPIENVKLDDVLDILKKSEETSPDGNTSGIIRIINNDISIRNGKYGPYVFYKTTKMKKPLFLKFTNFKEDYKTCTHSIFFEWLKMEHDI